MLQTGVQQNNKNLATKLARFFNKIKAEGALLSR